MFIVVACMYSMAKGPGQEGECGSLCVVPWPQAQRGEHEGVAGATGGRVHRVA